LKTCLISQEASMTLSSAAKMKSKFQQPLLDKQKQQQQGQDLISKAAERLQDLSEVLSDVTFRPFLWCEFDNVVSDRRLIERIKFNILEIQENFENFVDKKDYSLDVRFSSYRKRL